MECCVYVRVVLQESDEKSNVICQHRKRRNLVTRNKNKKGGPDKKERKEKKKDAKCNNPDQHPTPARILIQLACPPCLGLYGYVYP